MRSSLWLVNSASTTSATPTGSHLTATGKRHTISRTKNKPELHIYTNKQSIVLVG